MAHRTPFTFTLDLETHGAVDADRLRGNVERILDFLDASSIRATVFVVGELARDHPDLVRQVAAPGHEIAVHGWRHVPLAEVGAGLFVEETRRAKELLEELAEGPVVGYRAPTFSLVPDTPWAPDGLAELGFTYSSSVLPGRSPLYGYPDAPRSPFRWPSGLVELPVPVLRVAGVGFPLGGTYLRVLPWWVLARAVRGAAAEPVPMTYCHPYDFDPDEPFHVMEETGMLTSRLMWVGRRRMFDRISRLLADGSGPHLRDVVDRVDLTATAPGAAS